MFLRWGDSWVYALSDENFLCVETGGKSHTLIGSADTAFTIGRSAGYWFQFKRTINPHTKALLTVEISAGRPGFVDGARVQSIYFGPGDIKYILCHARIFKTADDIRFVGNNHESHTIFPPSWKHGSLWSPATQKRGGIYRASYRDTSFLWFILGPVFPNQEWKLLELWVKASCTGNRIEQLRNICSGWLGFNYKKVRLCNIY